MAEAWRQWARTTGKECIDKFRPKVYQRPVGGRRSNPFYEPVGSGCLGEMDPTELERLIKVLRCIRGDDDPFARITFTPGRLDPESRDRKLAGQLADLMYADLDTSVVDHSALTASEELHLHAFVHQLGGDDVPLDSDNWKTTDKATGGSRPSSTAAVSCTCCIFVSVFPVFRATE